jgi:hypothetical protein
MPLTIHQQAADELGGNLLGAAGEEGLGEVLGRRGWSWWLWEWLGGFVKKCWRLLTNAVELN